MECSDIRPPLSPHFVAFAWRYHPVRLYSSLPWTRRRPRAWGFRVWQPPATMFRSGNDRTSQVPGEPPRALAEFFDPGRTDAPGPTTSSARPPLTSRRRLLASGNFGAESPGFGTRCLRFVPDLTVRDARLASRCWPLCGAGLVTRWVLTKGFRVASYISSSFPKLSWRRPGQPGQLPALASRRSVHAQLRHTARLVTGSLRDGTPSEAPTRAAADSAAASA